MDSDKKIFHISPYISLCKTCNPGVESFKPRGQNLNKSGRGPLGDASYQISRLYPYGFREEDFFMLFPT